MKIVEATADHLILEDRPKFLAGLVWFMGLVSIWAAIAGETDGSVETALVALLGIGALWVAHHFFPYQRLTFDNKAGTFTRVVARLNGRKVATLSLPSIERAAVEAQWNDSIRMERLTLVTNAGKHPLELGFYGAPRGELVNEINAWLSDTRRI